MLRKTVISLGLFLLVPICLSAEIIISNPEESNTGGTYFPVMPAGEQWIKGMGFLMGSTPFTLDSVELQLCFSDEVGGCSIASYNGTSGTPVVRLFSDVTGEPSTELFTFINPTFALGTANYTFLPSSPFVLAAETAYWILVNSPDSNAFTWKASEMNALPSGAFASHHGQIIAGDPSSISNIYTVNGTAVPEPGVIQMLGIGFIGMIAMHHRLFRKIHL